MRTPARSYVPRRKWPRIGPGAITAIVIVVAAGALWSTGKIDLTRIGIGSKGPDTRGMIPIPVSAALIPEYTRITRDHLWNPKTGSFGMIYLRPEQITPDIIRSTGGIVGRVLDHDKPPGYVFTEADFLPRGTRPGLVAGIPSGKRAMRVEAEKIGGIFGLRPGDRFDVVSTLAIDAGRGAGSIGGPYSQQLDLQARLTNWQKQATVRVLVQNGQIVEGVTTRQVPVSANTLTSGLVIRNKPVQEVVVAVDPGEVAHLAEALAVGAELSCVPRSGRPDDPKDSITPESRPWSPFVAQQCPSSAETPSAAQPSPLAGPLSQGPLTTIETINGSKRDMVATPVKR